MPLRDFDQVQERIHVRLEVRHVVQAVAVGVALLGVAFGAGAWWAGRQPPSPPGAPILAQAPVTPPSAEGPVAVPSAPSTAEAPIVPVVARLEPHAAEPAGLRAELDEPAPAEAAPAEAAAADDGAGNQQLATAPEEREVPRVDPPMPAAPAPVVPPAKPAPVPEKVAAPAIAHVPETAPVAAAPTPATKPAVVAAALPPPPAPVVRRPVELPARTLTPPGLTLIGTARMVPAASLAPPPPPVVAKVVPDAAKPAPAAPAPVRKPVATRPHDDEARAAPVLGHYIIQIKAFRNADEAKSFEEDLRSRAWVPKLSSIEVPDKGTYYRVRLGPYDSLDAARAAQKKFEAAEGHVTILIAVP